MDSNCIGFRGCFSPCVSGSILMPFALWAIWGWELTFFLWLCLPPPPPLPPSLFLPQIASFFFFSLCRKTLKVVHVSLFVNLKFIFFDRSSSSSSSSVVGHSWKVLKFLGILTFGYFLIKHTNPPLLFPQCFSGLVNQQKNKFLPLFWVLL